MERDKRIELSALAWKAKVLPLYEPRFKKYLLSTTNDGNFIVVKHKQLARRC